MKNQKIKMKEMKNQKSKIKNEEKQEKGHYATKLICTKLPQRLIKSGKSVYKMLHSGFKKLCKLHKIEVRKQKVRKQKKQRLEHIAQIHNCAICLQILLKPITCGGIKNVYNFWKCVF